MGPRTAISCLYVLVYLVSGRSAFAGLDGEAAEGHLGWDGVSTSGADGIADASHPLEPLPVLPLGISVEGDELVASWIPGVDSSFELPDQAQDDATPSRAHPTNRRFLSQTSHTCAAIQTAATWQLQNGGGEVTLDPVEYDCSVGGPVRVPGSVGVTFRGSCVWAGNKKVCTTVNGWAQAPLFELGAGVYGFKSIVFTQSRGTALRSSGNLCISNCTFINNSGANGGAISTAGALMLSASTFQNNYASNVGGAIYAPSGRVSISGSTFTSNFANATGGALYAYSRTSLSIQGCTITNNAALGSGGAVTTFGAVDVTDTSFTGNTALTASGGAVAVSGGGPATFLRTSFVRNAAPMQYGGALYSYGGPHALESVSFQGNSAQGGGAIFLTGKALTCKDCTVGQNSASYGPLYDGQQSFSGANIGTCGFSGPNVPSGLNVLPDGCSVACPIVSEPQAAQICAATLFPPTSSTPSPTPTRTSVPSPVPLGTSPSTKPGLVIPTDASSLNPGFCPSEYNTCQTPQYPRSRFCCLARDGLSCCHNSASDPKCCLFGGNQQVDLTPVFLTTPNPDATPAVTIPPVLSPEPSASPSPRPFPSATPSPSPSVSRSPSPSPRPARSPGASPSPSPKPSPAGATAAPMSYDPVLRPNRCYTADGLTEFACEGATPQCCATDAAPKCCACAAGQC
ncbi:hypothetical protein KFL_000260570 [Klebsormidium nitens]|uniref:Right handed beta helix domain-containing protein n=1 Tax=Klebsormidium nitens TaxID=105231 RepID=A0A1Y1HKV6_KLENI|nr:hypothetical protein KFL_000260570 [Klebsormidium nitens]|eukprot:GAQ79240.1 hypothetical protein KFL_000260570 [Klebsormidium nitens]